MINLGQDEIAKYPFLADAGEYLRDKGFTLEQFGTDPDLKLIVDKAYQRIEVAANGQIFKSELSDNTTSSDSSLPREVFSFLLAVVLLKLSGMHTLIKRFSLAEARRAEKFLEKDLANLSDKKKEELATKIIDDLFSVKVQKIDDNFVIPVSDYLTHSINFHEREWKLVNRKVNDGFVFLTPHETVRLIRKELGNYINSKIQSVKTPEISGFEKPVQKLLTLSKKFSTNTVVSTEFPPCIKHAIEVLEKGENLPHSGRFMLATFLLTRGQSVEQIAPLFKNAPDYNEKITLYQLNHLAGESGSATKYSCPSCEKLKSQNLCFAIPECDNIINPLQFGRKVNAR